MPFSTVIKPAIGLAVLGVTIALWAGIAEWQVAQLQDAISFF